MEEIWPVLATLTAIMFMLTTYYVTTFVRAIKNHQKPDPNAPMPKAAVFLCLRGSDPYLADTIKSLVNQNYDNYTVKIIIDNESDPAAAVVEQVLKETKATNLEYTFLRKILHTCSLKCNSLIQALSEIDPSYEVYAFVDADIITYPDWLRELVSPLSDPSIGITTGNRWYMAMGKYWGTLIRYLWNSHIVLHLVAHRCPWGGSFAIRREVFHQIDLLDKWSRVLGEDVMIYDELAKVGLKVKFIPALIMINAEENDLKSLVYWIRRQFISVRLYHSLWGISVVEGIFFAAPYFTAIFAGLFYMVTQQWVKGAICWGILVSMIFAVISVKIYLETQVQPLVRAQGKTAVQITPRYVLNLILAAVPTITVTLLAALFSTVYMNHVNWRGVSYRIKGPTNIQLIEYRPYQPESKPVGHKISL